MSLSGDHGVSDRERRHSEFTLHRRVQWYELDSAGIVHFSTYFRYMEEAEHALWRAAGLSIAPPNAEIGYPRISVACEYHRPLHFEDEFEVRIRVAAMTDKTLRYVCVLMRGETKIATGTMTTVCVQVRPGEPMRAVPLPADIRSRFLVAQEHDA